MKSYTSPYSGGQRSLAYFSAWDCKESDTNLVTEQHGIILVSSVQYSDLIFFIDYTPYKVIVKY